MDSTIRLQFHFSTESDESGGLSGSDNDEEEYISERTCGSDSEQDLFLNSEECLEPTLQNEPQGDTRFLYGKDRQTKWSKDILGQHKSVGNIITGSHVKENYARNAKTELDCWELFITDYILEKILTHTNVQITQKQKLQPSKTQSAYMKVLCMNELKACLGLLIIAGMNKSNRQNLKDLWRSDGTGLDIFRNTMSLQRFNFLLNCLRFDDRNTRSERQKYDNLAAIRDIFTNFVESCQTSYSPSEFVTIDEKLDSFRGRCSFIQHMPKKRAKCGIKMYLLVDSKTFFVVNLEIYTREQPSGEYKKSNKPFDVVDRLVQPISQSHRNVTFDNWFCSYSLVQHLLRNHKLTAVATIKINKREIPPQMINSKSREPNSSQFVFQEDTTLVSYVPKKNKVILAISTLHSDDQIDSSSGNAKKPEIITFYNKTKGSVDVVDELCANYDVSRKSKRWPLTVFFSMLNMAAINSYIIYKANNNLPKLTHRNFLRSIGLQLVENHLRARKEVPSLHRGLQTRISEHFGETPAKIIKRTNISIKRCQECPSSKDRKTKYTCLHCNKYLCLEHAGIICKKCSISETSE